MAESVIQAVIGKIMDYSTDALKKQVNYFCCYSCNVQTLVDEVGDLNIRHESVQQDIDVARANSGVIRPEVEAWLRKVEELKSRSDEICGDAEEIQRSSVCKCFPLLHYSLSRKALKAARDSVELRNTKLDKIFNPVILAEISPVPTTSNVGFKSRNFIEDRIMDALKDPSVYSIGIWGIGGVGKTVMAKKIEEKVRDEKSLFEHVVMVVVSQQPDLPKIQGQIAEGLGLTLNEESPVFRQRKLHRRLMAEKSILIILDDLWESLDLEEFGIPSQVTHTHCKLILTSRNRDALTSTGVPVQNIFQLEILTEEESWRFFRDNVGINPHDEDSHNELVQIAKKVEKECKQLPLALKIVASALKDKDICFWGNAVRELEKSVPDNIPGVSKGVYGPLLYSINALEGIEQKDLFLLCCLFPEDYSISIKELLRCGIGLRIFKGLENLIVVRDKVETMLKILVSRSLLIGENEYSENFKVRMHDVIRDVGIWIATEEGMVGSNKEKHLFMISHGLNEWPLMMEEYSTCISLQFSFSHHSIIFPESIVCPKLEFLRLDFVKNNYGVYNGELPENFFNGMGGLRVLEALRIGFLPSSIGQLSNLCTLFLRRCKIFETISMLGKLINLEILSLKDCEFELLPKEIGGLKKLKQMDILNCKSLRRIAFGVISRLARLEELVILGSFDSWEAKDGKEQHVACLSELNDLKNLITLKIEIKNPSVVPRQKPLWIQKVKKYGITISKCSFDYGKKYFQKAILLGKEVVNPLGDWIYDMASDAEYLLLEGSNCMSILKRLSQNSSNLSCLKQLRLSEFSNIRYLVQGLQKGAMFPNLASLNIRDSISLQHISDFSPPIGSFVALQHINFSNLSGFLCLWKVPIKEQLYLKSLQSVEINECDNLLYMFSLSIAQSLVQLSYLQVSSCEAMKEIFKKDGELIENNKIELPKLRFLSFKNLKSFCHFCNEIDRIELPELLILSLRNLPSMKIAKGDNNGVYEEYLIPKVIGMNFNFCGLNVLEVEGFGNFKCMFSPSVISRVPTLRILEVKNCSMLEQVIGKDDEIVGGTILFPNLKKLILENLPNILNVCYKHIQMPSLEVLKISQCPQMLKFVEELSNRISSTRSFLHEQVQCSKLKKLTLDQLNILVVFSPLSFKSVTNLQKLKLTCCEELEHVIAKERQRTTNMEEESVQKISLKSLTLIKLPKLYGSIFQMKQHLEFPSIEIIKIEDCPMLEKFSFGSLHLPKLKSVSGFLSNEFAANFFFHTEMSFPEIQSENNYFIIFVKDISFSSNVGEDNGLCFLAPGSSGGSFLDAVSFPLNDETKKIVGKFKTEKIMTGIVYEIMLMIMVDYYNWEDPIEIELKLFGGSEQQKRTEILGNQPIETWTEISIGKFMREPQQINEELEFSLYQRESLETWNMDRRLSIKGVRFLEV